MAISASAPDMHEFRRGLDFSACLGLVPRQHSSGGKQKLGCTSKMGQRDIRRLLIVGALSVVRWRGRDGGRPGSWLSRMLARKPRMLGAIALANKMARMVWAMLVRNEDYRDPASAVRLLRRQPTSGASDRPGQLKIRTASQNTMASDRQHHRLS